MLDLEKRRRAEELEAFGDYAGAAKVFEGIDLWDRALAAWNQADAEKAAQAKSRAMLRAEALVRLKKFSKAASIYERLGMPEEAGASWMQSQNWLKAIGCWRQANDQQRLAEAIAGATKRAGQYEADGQWFWAAKYWEHLGDDWRAAEAWEKERNWPAAARRYEQAGRWVQASKAWQRAGEHDAFRLALQNATKQAGQLETDGLFTEAARVWEQLGNWKNSAHAWEEAENFGRAATAYSKADLKADASRCTSMATRQAERMGSLSATEWKQIGDWGKASEGWTRHEWEGVAEKLESGSKMEQAAKAWEKAGQWLRAGRLWERQGRWVNAKNCYARTGNLENLLRAEKKVAEEAMVAEQSDDWQGAAKLWESVSEWQKAADAWSRTGDYGGLRRSLQRAAIKAENSKEWEQAALHWKSVRQYPRAVQCFNRSRKAKTPEEDEFFMEVLLQDRSAAKVLEQLERFDWVCYAKLLDAALSTAHTCRQVCDCFDAALKTQDFYVVMHAAPFAKAAAFWASDAGSLTKVLRKEIEFFSGIFDFIKSRGTKMVCLYRLLGAYRSLLLVSHEQEDLKTVRLCQQKIEHYTDAYLSLWGRHIRSERFLRHYLSYLFLKEKYRDIPPLIRTSRQYIDGDLADTTTDLAHALSSATNTSATAMYYQYVALQNVPKSPEESKQAFIGSKKLPLLKYEQPEYLTSWLASEKIELRHEIYNHYQGILAEADSAYKVRDLERAVGLYEQILEYPLAESAKKRILGNLTDACSLLRDKSATYFHKWRKYSNL